MVAEMEFFGGQISFFFYVELFFQSDFMGWGRLGFYFKVWFLWILRTFSKKFYRVGKVKRFFFVIFIREGFLLGVEKKKKKREKTLINNQTFSTQDKILWPHDVDFPVWFLVDIIRLIRARPLLCIYCHF